MPQTLTLALALARFSRAIELIQWREHEVAAIIFNGSALSRRQRADIASLSITYQFAVAFA